MTSKTELAESILNLRQEREALNDEIRKQTKELLDLMTPGESIKTRDAIARRMTLHQTAIDDPTLIPAALTKTIPDKSRITQLLKQGTEVPGAHTEKIKRLFFTTTV